MTLELGAAVLPGPGLPYSGLNFLYYRSVKYVDFFDQPCLAPGDLGATSQGWPETRRGRTTGQLFPSVQTLTGRDWGRAVYDIKERFKPETQAAMGPLNAASKVGFSQVLHNSCGPGCGDVAQYTHDQQLERVRDAGLEVAANGSTRPLTVSQRRAPVFSLWRFFADAARRLWGEPEVRRAGACKEVQERMPGVDGSHQRISISSLCSTTATDISRLSPGEHKERRGKSITYKWEDNNQWKLLETTEGWEDIRWAADDATEKTPVLVVGDRCDSWTPHRCDHELKEHRFVFGEWCTRPFSGSLDGLNGYLGGIALYEDGPLTIGARSAPAECQTPGVLDDNMCPPTPEGRFNLPDDDLSDSDDCFFSKEHKTILDLLELASELRRREVLYRIDCERKEIQRLRNDVRTRKLEFEQLKSGMSVVTPQVAYLRRRWGSRQRIKCRERLAHIKQHEEDDLWSDIPLLAY